MQSKRIRIVRPPKIVVDVRSENHVDSVANKHNSALKSVDSVVSSAIGTSLTTNNVLIENRCSDIDVSCRLQTTDSKSNAKYSENTGDLEVFEKLNDVHVSSIDSALQSFLVKKLQLIEKERQDCGNKPATDQSLLRKQCDEHESEKPILHSDQSTQHNSELCECASFSTGKKLENPYGRKKKFIARHDHSHEDGLHKLWAQDRIKIEQNQSAIPSTANEAKIKQSVDLQDKERHKQTTRGSVWDRLEYKISSTCIKDCPKDRNYVYASSVVRQEALKKINNAKSSCAEGRRESHIFSNFVGEQQTNFENDHSNEMLEIEERSNDSERLLRTTEMKSGTCKKKLKSGSKSKAKTEISFYTGDSLLRPSWMNCDQLFADIDSKKSRPRSKDIVETEIFCRAVESLPRPIWNTSNPHSSDRGPRKSRSKSKGMHQTGESSCAIDSLLRPNWMKSDPQLHVCKKKKSSKSKDKYCSTHSSKKHKKHKLKHSLSDLDIGHHKHKSKSKKHKRSSQDSQSELSGDRNEGNRGISFTTSINEEVKVLDSHSFPSFKTNCSRMGPVCKQTETICAAAESGNQDEFIPRKVYLKNDDDDDDDDLVGKLIENEIKKPDRLAIAESVKSRFSICKFNSVDPKLRISNSETNDTSISESNNGAGVSNSSEKVVEEYKQMCVATENNSKEASRKTNVTVMSCSFRDNDSLNKEEVAEFSLSSADGNNVEIKTASSCHAQCASSSCYETSDNQNPCCDDLSVKEIPISPSVVGTEMNSEKMFIVPVDATMSDGSAPRQSSSNDGSPFKIPQAFPHSTVRKPMALRLGLKITDSSAAIISSGVMQATSRRHLEEGELSDSAEEESDSNEDVESIKGSLITGASLNSRFVDDLDTSGSLTDSGDEAKDQSPSTDLIVSKKHCDQKSKKSRKHKKSHKQSKLDTCKRVKNKSSLSKKRKVRSPSRSRARSFSVMRTFDTKKGVWRLRKKSEIKARQMAALQLRPLNDLRLQIDKQRLREIAMRNAYKHMKAGTGPAVKLRATDLCKITQGGKTITELTELCKSMIRSNSYDSDNRSSDEESAGCRRRLSVSDDDDGNLPRSQLRLARDNNIKISIRNARQLPILSKEDKMAQATALRLNFPVSSGMHHRSKEWQPVEKKTSVQDKLPASRSKKTTEEKIDSAAKEVTAGVNVKNIGQIVSERLNALRQLSANPNNVDAMNAAYQAEQQLQQWALSKKGFVPQGVRPPPKPRPLFKTIYSRQSVLRENAPTIKAGPLASTSVAVTSCTTVGKLLLQKMGWKEGEGLGRNSTGPTALLEVDMKMDRKGLDWVEPRLPPPPRPAPVVATPSVPSSFHNLSKMHPISALIEICIQKRWMQPVYELIEDSGPPHRKSFRYKAIVDGVEYRPACSSRNKKTARAEAAVACLHQLANLPIFRSLCPPTSAPVVPQSAGCVIRLPCALSFKPSPVPPMVKPRLVEPKAELRTPVVAGLNARAPRPIIPPVLRAPFGPNETVPICTVAIANPPTDFTEDDFSVNSPNFAYGADGFAINMETEYDEDGDEDPFEEEQFDFDVTELPAELFQPRSFIEESDYVHEAEDCGGVYDEPFAAVGEHSDNVLSEFEQYTFESNAHPFQQPFPFAGHFNQLLSDQFAFDRTPRTRMFGNQAELLGPHPQQLHGRGVEFGFQNAFRFQFARSPAVVRQQSVRSLMSFSARPVVHRLLFPQNLP